MISADRREVHGIEEKNTVLAVKGRCEIEVVLQRTASKTACVVKSGALRPTRIVMRILRLIARPSALGQFGSNDLRSSIRSPFFCFNYGGVSKDLPETPSLIIP